MTPNGDGLNDLWEIRWPAHIRPQDYTLELFNRAGGRVLHMQGLTQGWDGADNPDGVYWWVLSTAGKVVDQGGLTIRRK
jgi:gliding motility-associated-like protein